MCLNIAKSQAGMSGCHSSRLWLAFLKEHHVQCGDTARHDFACVSGVGSSAWLKVSCVSPCGGSGMVSLDAMNKRALIKDIVAKLTSELELYFRAAQSSRAEASHEQNKPENKYDTRGLEASYLARGQSRQAAELETAIAEFEKLDARKFAAGEAIGMGALVELETGAETSFYFIGPRAGGMEVARDKQKVLIITPLSPLGAQLMDKKQGDHPQLELGSRREPARIISVH